MYGASEPQGNGFQGFGNFQQFQRGHQGQVFQGGGQPHTGKSFQLGPKLNYNQAMQGNQQGGQQIQSGMQYQGSQLLHNGMNSQVGNVQSTGKGFQEGGGNTLEAQGKFVGSNAFGRGNQSAVGNAFEGGERQSAVGNAFEGGERQSAVGNAFEGGGGQFVEGNSFGERQVTVGNVLERNGENFADGNLFENGGGRFEDNLFPGVLNSNVDGSQQIGAGEIATALRRQYQHRNYLRHRMNSIEYKRTPKSPLNKKSINRSTKRNFYTPDAFPVKWMKPETFTSHMHDSFGKRRAHNNRLSEYCRKVCGNPYQLNVVVDGLAKKRWLEKRFFRHYKQRKTR